MGSGRGWLAGDWQSTGGVLNITAAACTAGFHWWRSGNITRTQNVSEYMLVLAVCPVVQCVQTFVEIYRKDRILLHVFNFIASFRDNPRTRARSQLSPVKQCDYSSIVVTFS